MFQCLREQQVQREIMIVIEIHVPVHIPGSVFCGIEVSREYEAYYSYLFFCTQGTGNGFLFSFNPISGEPVDTPPTGQVLNYRITQTSMLGELDDHFLRGILLMDPDNQVRPLPTHTFQCYLDRSLNMCKLRQY